MTSPQPITPLQRYLRVQRAADRELDALLREAAADAQARVRALAGKDTIGAQVRRAQYSQVRAELLRTAQGLWPMLSAALRGQLGQAVRAAADAAIALDRMVFRAVGGMPTGLAEAIRAQAKDTARLYEARTANGIPLSTQVYRTQKLASGFVDKQINIAILNGESWKELADRVKGSIDPGTKGGVAYAAKRLGRTELNNAFHTAQKVAHEKEPWVDSWQWHLSHSHPTPDKCDEYATGIHYQGGLPGRFHKDALPRKPHPQCLCYTTAEAIPEDQFVSAYMDGAYDRYLDSIIDTYAPHLSGSTAA